MALEQSHEADKAPQGNSTVPSLGPGKQIPDISTALVHPSRHLKSVNPQTYLWNVWHRELEFTTPSVPWNGQDLNNWQDLPLSRRLGISLRFRKCGTGGPSPQVNVFTETMGIDPDFDSRNDIDIANTGFRTTVPEAILGGVEVVRDDGERLNYQDLEALWKYVEQFFPHLRFLSSAYPQTERPRSFVQII